MQFLTAADSDTMDLAAWRPHRNGAAAPLCCECGAVQGVHCNVHLGGSAVTNVLACRRQQQQRQWKSQRPGTAVSLGVMYACCL
jgi:hypothetical protein